MSIQVAILRHAIAEDGSATGSDFDRRVTRAGLVELELHLDLLASWGWAPSVVFHSPYVRTTQTAVAVVNRFGPLPVLATDVIVHGRPDEILRLCAGHVAPLIVGHEPTVGELVAHLLGAPPGGTSMARAGFALLDVDRIPTTRPARLRMFLPPQTSGSE